MDGTFKWVVGRDAWRLYALVPGRIPHDNYVGYLITREGTGYQYRAAVWDDRNFTWEPVYAPEGTDTPTYMRLIEAVYALEN